MKNFIIGLFVAVIVIILDQYSKITIFTYLYSQNTRELIIFPFFNLVIVYNTGVSFGMFNSIVYGDIILSGIAILIAIFLIIWMWKANKIYLNIALGLIIGGAIGNIIDRILYGAVSDFLDFHIAEYHWPAFNLADSFVFIGVAMILLENVIIKKEKKNV